MIIRNRKYEEMEEIHSLIENAFKTAKYRDGGEQDLVVILRNSEKYIKELELVCSEGGKLIAHVMLTHKTVQCTSKKTLTAALLLAPLCVDEKYRNTGIGTALLCFALARAKMMGFRCVFLAGDPNYYTRFGFKQTTLYNIKNVNDIEDKFVMVLELEKGCLDEISGTVDMYK